MSWNKLKSRIRKYNPNADVELLDSVHDFVKDRCPEPGANGDAHPCMGNALAVSAILVNLRLDVPSLAAGLLLGSNCIRRGGTEGIGERFGVDIGALVKGVSRVSGLVLGAGSEEQAEDFRKMFLAMAKDLRVILVRMAICLQKARLMASGRLDEDPAFAREILDIYAPISHRLGIHWIKSEFEDLAFRGTEPEAYRRIKDHVESSRKGGQGVVGKVVAILKKKLKKLHINAKVAGREKHLYSIWTKLDRKNIDLEEVADVIAYRIIVKKREECYRALGMIHSEFRPIPGRFKDYIGLPKSNGYQSLHTVVFGPFGNRIEIQIRTERMHQVAEDGVASHWIYKGKNPDKKAVAGLTGYSWLKRLLEIHQSADSPGQFMENVRIDLFPEEIYIFTPAGDIRALPQGSTPVDFAYAVHSAIGDSCRGAKVNNRIVTLRHKLETGDKVEIIRSKEGRPNPTWLKFVVTARAKYRISRYIKAQQKEQAIKLGRELLEREARSREVGRGLKEKDLTKLAPEFNLTSANDLLAQVGQSLVTPGQVLSRLFPATAPCNLPTTTRIKGEPGSTVISKRTGREGGLKLTGLLPDMAVFVARCCSPVPGDPVVGIISSGKGVTLHTNDCPNLKALADEPQRWIEEIEWPALEAQEYLARLRVMVKNQKEMLWKVSQAVIESGGEIVQIKIQDRDQDPAVLFLETAVKGKSHLAEVLESVNGLEMVYGAERVKG